MADSATIDFSGVVAALNRNSDLLERVVAGQEAAMAKLGDAKPATRSRTPKATDPVVEQGNAAPAATESAEAGAAAAADAAPALPTTVDEMKSYCGAWTATAANADAKNAMLAFFRDAAAKLGGAGTAGLLLDAKKSVFWIERKKAGLDVDFDATYDFGGDPKQAAPAATSDDDFG